MCDLPPNARRAEQIVRELSAISVGHGCEDIAAVFGAFQRNLRNSRKLPADGVCVLICVRSQTVKINLLVKVDVLLWSFSASWIAGVIKAGAVRVPRHTTARGTPVHPRNHIRQRLSASDIVNVDVTVFAAALGK